MKGILSCVVDQLPVDVSLSVLPVPTSTADPTVTITRTRTVCIAPTETPQSHHKTVRERSDIDLSQIPIVNLITALVDRLPVNADLKVLPGGLQELSDIDLQRVLSCVVDRLPVDLSLSVLPVPTSSTMP